MKIIEHVMGSNGAYLQKLGDLLEQEEKKLEEKKSECTRVSADTENGMSNKELEPKLSQFENLSLIFTIFKNILVIADKNLIDMLLSDNFYLITFGALEYDFESQKIIRHRQFFKENAHFTNILSLSDDELLSKIHLNHRAAYLRDTAIGRFIEESTMKNINMSIHLNNSDIIQYFLSNKHLITKAIEKMMDDDIQTKKDGTAFLLELMSCSRELIQNRIFFYETLCDLNLLDALEKTLVEVTPSSEYQRFVNQLSNPTSQEKAISIEENKIMEEIKVNSIEILIGILIGVPHILKNYIVTKSQYKEHSLLSAMCSILIHQENFGIKYEIGEILKSLLDNEVTEKKNEFYDLFYNKCLSRLVEFLSIPINMSYKYQMTSSKQIIIEIICHCLKQHGNRVTYWAIHNNLIEKIINVLQDNVKILKLQVIKFLKSVIVNNDENLNKIIIYGDIFSHVIKLCDENKTKNNLILSAILDLFDYLKKSPQSKKIVSYIFEKHNSFFYNDANKSSFSGLISKFENGNEQINIQSCNTPEEKQHFHGILTRELSQKEDEDYFNRDEDNVYDGIFHSQENSHQMIGTDEIHSHMISDDNNNTILGRKTGRDDFEKIYNDPEFKENEEEIYRRINKKSKKEEDEDEDDDSA